MHNPALAIALLAMTFANELSASEAQPSDSTIEEVVVIGSVLYRDQVNALKTPTPIIDVPQSVAVIIGAEIQSRGCSSISDLINYVPELSSSRGQGIVMLWSFVASALSPTFLSTECGTMCSITGRFTIWIK